MIDEKRHGKIWRKMHKNLDIKIHPMIAYDHPGQIHVLYSQRPCSCRLRICYMPSIYEFNWVKCYSEAYNFYVEKMTTYYCIPKRDHIKDILTNRNYITIKMPYHYVPSLFIHYWFIIQSSKVKLSHDLIWHIWMLLLNSREYNYTRKNVNRNCNRIKKWMDNVQSNIDLNFQKHFDIWSYDLYEWRNQKIQIRYNKIYALILFKLREKNKDLMVSMRINTEIEVQHKYINHLEDDFYKKCKQIRDDRKDIIKIKEELQSKIQ